MYPGRRYISITANYTDEWKQWWFNPDKVELFQFMAKDNVTFHGVIFPGSLMATRNDWTMVKMIAAIGMLVFTNQNQCRRSCKYIYWHGCDGERGGGRALMYLTWAIRSFCIRCGGSTATLRPFPDRPPLHPGVEYLNYEDDKFSKSRGVGVFGNDAKTVSTPL